MILRRIDVQLGFISSSCNLNNVHIADHRFRRKSQRTIGQGHQGKQKELTVRKNRWLSEKGQLKFNCLGNIRTEHETQSEGMKK